MLNKFADVRNDAYVQTTDERMRIEVIGQRLLTGRLAIAEATPSRPRLHLGSILAPSRLYPGSISALSRLHLGSISAPSRLYLGSISAVSRLYLGCLSALSLAEARPLATSAPSRLPLGCLSAVSRLSPGCLSAPLGSSRRTEHAITAGALRPTSRRP